MSEDVQYTCVVDLPADSGPDRYHLYGPHSLRARFAEDTWCARCSQRVRAGEHFNVHLAKEFDAAVWEHRGDCPIEVES